MERFDVCVIGAGPSGFAAAMRAVDFGKKTLLIEKDRVGGAGIYNGALSSKTMWELADNYNVMRSEKYGYKVNDYFLSYEDLSKEVDKAVAERASQLEQQINSLKSNSLLSFSSGFAKLLSKNEIQIKSGSITNTVWAENIVLATGSRPRRLPDIPIDEDIIVTSDGVQNWKKFPESIVILGAGVIGCEFATILSNFRRTKVYLIDKQPRILPFEDEDIAAEVSKNLERMGVTIHREAELESMKTVNGKVLYTLKYRSGETKSFEVEKALISVGRIPNVEGLGLENAGVEVNAQNFCENEDCRTNVPNIYAVGDLTADIALVNIAELEGRHAIEKAYQSKTKPISYNNISTIMFLNPEVAAVGMNEMQAQKNKIPYKIAKISYSHIPRAIAKRELEGFFKIMVSDDNKMQILGIRAIGAHASSNIQAIALLIYMGKGLDELVEMVHAHPSMPEGVQECARLLMGSSIMKASPNTPEICCYRVDENGQRSPIDTQYYLNQTQHVH